MLLVAVQMPYGQTRRLSLTPRSYASIVRSLHHSLDSQGSENMHKILERVRHGQLNLPDRGSGSVSPAGDGGAGWQWTRSEGAEPLATRSFLVSDRYHSSTELVCRRDKNTLDFCWVLSKAESRDSSVFGWNGRFGGYSARATARERPVGAPDARRTAQLNCRHTDHTQPSPRQHPG